MKSNSYLSNDRKPHDPSPSTTKRSKPYLNMYFFASIFNSEWVVTLILCSEEGKSNSETSMLTFDVDSPARTILLSAFGVESPEEETSYRKRASSGLETVNEKLLEPPRIK